jgi:O-antigen/teichoic acid export membrane protein
MRSIARNAVFKGAGELLVRLLAFAFVVYVARALQPADFGVLNFAYSFPLLFVVIVDFGFNPLLIREASRRPAETAHLFHNLLVLKLALAAGYLAAVGLGTWGLAPGPAFRPVTLLLAGFMLLNSFTEYVNAVFQAKQQMQLEAGVMAWQKLSLLGFGLLALGLGQGLLGVAAAYLAAGVCGLTAAALVLRRTGYAAGSWRLDAALLRAGLRQALPLTLTTLFINLYFRIDMTLLARMRPAAEVGWYGAAHKCIEVLMLVPAVLVASAFPGLSQLQASDPERLRRAARQLLRVLLLLALPLAAGAVCLGRPLMVLCFGPDFAPAGAALGWLGAALALIFWNYPLSYLLISAGRQRVNAVVSGLAVVVGVGANLLLIPAFGYLGSAAAAVITEGFLLAAYAWAVRRMFRLYLGDSLLRTALATLVMAVPVWFLRAWNPLAVMALGAAAYAGALVLLKAVTPEDGRLLLRLITRRGDD